MGNKPWTTGPGEILQHAITLLAENTDTSRRLALILVDNAVELTIKTYLSLPRRITGIKLSRAQFTEIRDRFDELLDALEVHAAEKIAGLDLGEIEFFHRLRNELYHQGNGLTADARKVEAYTAIAKLLFKNLFEEELPTSTSGRIGKIGDFMDIWSTLEKGRPPKAVGSSIPNWLSRVSFSDRSMDFRKINDLRNRIVHGEDYSDAEIDEAIANLTRMLEELRKRRKPE